MSCPSILTKPWVWYGLLGARTGPKTTIARRAATIIPPTIRGKFLRTANQAPRMLRDAAGASDAWSGFNSAML